MVFAAWIALPQLGNSKPELYRYWQSRYYRQTCQSCGAFTARSVLNDYVPFYFTPFSPMMYNIHTGRGVPQQHSNADIIFLVARLHRIQECGLPFVFTNAHAVPEWTEYYNSMDRLTEIDWALLRSRNFQRDLNDPQKFESYQAEALIHNHVPVEALLGLICYNQGIETELKAQVQAKGLELKVHAISGWYF